jgi:hypothetical protein
MLSNIQMENQEHKMMVLDMDPVILYATGGFLLEFGEDGEMAAEFSRQTMRQVCIVNDIAEEDAMDLAQLGERSIEFAVPTSYVLALALEFSRTVEEAKNEEESKILRALQVLVRQWITPITDAIASQKGHGGADRAHRSMN